MGCRALLFPAESVGTVEEIKSGRKQPAAGSVQVDADGPVRLMLERNHAEVLSSLGPDDIQSLYLWGAKSLKTAAISSLGRLTGLVELHAPRKGAWDDQACEVLSQLTGLRSLGVLRAYGVTDQGFLRLRGLTQLQKLRVEQAVITDAALAALGCMPLLASLDLSGCRSLTSEALRHVGDCPDLSWLSLTGVPVGDEGLAHLASNRALRFVDLGSTGVTDEGLRHLPANEPPLRVVSPSGRSRAQWATLLERYPHLDFGGVRELTTDPSTRQRVREHGTTLAGFSVPDDGPLLAIFTTDNCAPCERMLPVVTALGQHWNDRLATVRVHCPEHPDIAAALDIQSAPTLVLFTAAERTVRFPGSLVLEDLKAELSPYLGFAVR